MANNSSHLDQLISVISSTDGPVREVLTLMAATGLLIAPFLALKFLLSTFRVFKLYVLSQTCCASGSDTLKYGKWVVVTGATDGIGQSMAREFARRGHSIMIVGRNSEKITKTKALLEAEPNVGQVDSIKIDLADSSVENYKRIWDHLTGNNRDIGILVNNAGMGADKFERFAEFDLESIRDTVNVNNLAMTYFTRMVLPGMLDRKRGLIVNVSSLAGGINSGYIGIYGPTKSFVNSFSETLQLEYSSSPVTIINLTPGPVITKILATLDFKQPNLLAPSSDYYAKSAINALRAGVKSYSGCLVHAIMRTFLIVTEYLGLLHGLFLLYLRWKNQAIPPLASERKSS